MLPKKTPPDKALPESINSKRDTARKEGYSSSSENALKRGLSPISSGSGTDLDEFIENRFNPTVSESLRLSTTQKSLKHFSHLTDSAKAVIAVRDAAKARNQKRAEEEVASRKSAQLLRTDLDEIEAKALIAWCDLREDNREYDMWFSVSNFLRINKRETTE